MNHDIDRCLFPAGTGLGGSSISRREWIAAVGAGVSLLQTGCTPTQEAGNDSEQAGTPLHYATLLDVAGRIERGEVSPTELTEAILARISEIDGRLMSYATVMAEEAMAAAVAAEREIDSGTYRGPLHGVPIAVKDLCFTAGTRTMAGSSVFRDFVPDYDATVVTRLEDAGAVILGKLNLTEGAMIGYHPDFDIPVNPWREDLWPGVSSSGSGVATAAGLCFGCLGTDTGGSIRFPSMANGVVGLKPTYGRVSRHGVFTLADSLDHVGPMTRSVADAAAMFQVIAGSDPADPTTLADSVPDLLAGLTEDLGGLAVGIDRAYASEGIDPGLAAAIATATEQVEALGASIVELELPTFDQQLYDDWFLLCAFEAAVAHRETYPSRAAEYGPALRDVLQLGASTPETAYNDALSRREGYREALTATLADFDAVIIPPPGIPAPFPRELQYASLGEIMAEFGTLRDQRGTRDAAFFTFPADMAGVPTLTQPCGMSGDGLPLSIQFMGSPLSEPTLCRIGHAFEQTTEWHRNRPMA